MQLPSLREAEEWMSRASRDLLFAGRALEDPALPEAAVYHAQQAAEKSLKGFLTLHGQPFDKTHILERLLTSCQSIEPQFASHLIAAQTLTPYVAQFRYPGGDLAPPLAEAQEALRLATEIVAFVRQQMPAPGSQ